ncbi:MAG: hypothetical protein QOG68_1710, partial [Solirubrobacteraceae bacterium]|nr:hypothetical protein [Solirubrobacteraceae bacterium]
GTDRSPVVEVRDPTGKLVLDDTGAEVQGLPKPVAAPKPVDIAQATPPPAAEQQQKAPQGILHNDGSNYHDDNVDMRHTTLVLIRKPLKGTYTITTKQGSAPIEAISHADAIAKESAQAGVVSSDKSKTEKMLSLKAAMDPGSTMTITEEGRDLSHQLAVITAKLARPGARAHAASVTRHITFKPAPGDREKRRIIGVISRDGIPVKRIVLGHYKAPGAPHAGRVRRLRVTRTANRLVVRFKPAAHAVQHVIRVKLGGRVSELVVGAKARRVVIATALARRGGSVTVRAIGPLSIPGAAVKRRVAPIKVKRVKHFVV